MGHIVDEVVFHLVHLFLTESDHNRIYEYQQKNKCERKRRYHEPDRAEQIVGFGRKIHFKIIDLVDRIVGKQRLCVHLLALLLPRHSRGKSRRMVDQSAVTVGHSKLKRYLQPVVFQFETQEITHHQRVGALSYGAIAAAGNDI